MSAALTTPAQPADLAPTGPTLTYPKLDALPADLLALVDELVAVESETDRWNIAYRAAKQAAREGSPVLGAHVEQAAVDVREGAL